MGFRSAPANLCQPERHRNHSRRLGTAKCCNWTAAIYRVSRLAQSSYIVGIDEVGGSPAVEIVFGHAAIGEALPALVLARTDGRQQREAPDFLVTARVIDLVELVARAEFRADR